MNAVLDRSVSSVCRRVLVVRALKLASPRATNAELGEHVGMSGASISNYLHGKVKAFHEVPGWRDQLYVAAGRLFFGDLRGAAQAFRELADELEKGK